MSAGNASPREIGIALLGLGNVGGGTLQILESHGSDIERRLGARVKVRHVLVRDPGKARARAVPAGLLTCDAERIFADPGVAVVVELLGGIHPARELLLRAIETGRHVVTANKALLSTHGEELFVRALGARVDVHFEGAVCGGVPIIRTLREALASDRIEGIWGIVNGTTNLILSSMAEGEADYSQALAQAQAQGYAEADPTLDVSGMDAAQKLCLLTSLAFLARVQPTAIPVEGITALLPLDFVMAREFGFTLKLLAIAQRLSDGSIDARVHPALIPRRSPLAEVRGPYNAVLLRSAALGASLLYGRGAGAMPTGSAVVADIIDSCRNLLAGVSGRLPMLCPPHLSDVPLRSAAAREGRFYLRFSVSDEPGVLGRIASVLGEKGVSLAQVVQRPARPGEKEATILVLTHRARERDALSAVQWIDQLRSTQASTQLIRIEDQPPVAPEPGGGVSE